MSFYRVGCTVVNMDELASISYTHDGGAGANVVVTLKSGLSIQAARFTLRSDAEDFIEGCYIELCELRG